MIEQLPISIDVCDELSLQFTKITSVCNKLEAQFNFQTMTANWYSDEDNILQIKLSIETPQEFALHKEKKSQYTIENHSDDVFSYTDNIIKQQTIFCYVALTDSELTLLNQQQKLLSGLLSVKLLKVVNLIAKKLTLDTI
jgi:hypothetical protein